MKFPITTAAFLALLHSLAAGDVYLYESFAGYASGQLPGQTISSLAVGLDTTTSIIGGGTAAVNTLEAVGLELGSLQVSGGRALYSSPTGAASYTGFRYIGPEVTGTLYSSFLTRIETSQNNASSVGLRVNTLNNSSGASSHFYTFADTVAGTRTGIQYENAAAGTVSSTQTLPLNAVHVVIGRFTRVGQSLTLETPGLATTYVLTATQFDHFKAGGFTDAELDNALIGTGELEVFSRVSDDAVTSGNFNILTSGRGIQFGVGNAGMNQTVSYDEIRFGSSLDAVLPLQVSSSTVVSLSTTRAFAPEPVAGNDAPGEIMATRVGSTESALTVQLVSSGTAIAGVDYLTITSLTFPPGEGTVTLAVKPFTDALAEGDETVTYTLAGGAGYTLGNSSTAAVTITDRSLGMDASKSRFIQKMESGIPQKIVVYGTSLTAGGQWSSQMLAAFQASYPGLVTLANSGGSGMESNWGVANLQTRVLDQNPDVVFIEFSVNDSVDRFNLSLAHANANLATMINGIKTARPECEIILQVMNPVIDRPEGNPGWRPNLYLYQQAYREIGKQNRLLVIDHMPAWQAVLDEGEAIYRGFVSDGLHPGAEGYERFVTPSILQAVGHVAIAAPSLIVDNSSAVASGAWTNSAATPGFYGSDYLHDGDAGKGTKSVTFTPQISAAGRYPVYLRWTADANRGSTVPVTITHSGGTTVVTVNQRLNNGVWVLLGTFDFAAGSSGSIRIDTIGTNGYVIADAVGIGVPDGLPGVMLRGDNGRASEPPSAASVGRNSRIIVARTGPTTAPLSVNVAISGSADAAVDYALVATSIVIPAGASSAFLTLSALGDELAEGEESFLIVLAPDMANYVLGTPLKALIVIEDQPFDGWRFARFTAPQLADSLISGDLADPDGDGLGNLLEFFMGRQPQLADSQGATLRGSQTVAGLNYQTLTFNKRIVSGLTSGVEISSDLLVWSSGDHLLEESIVTDDGLTQVVRVRSRVPLDSSSAEFLRLMVVQEP